MFVADAVVLTVVLCTVEVYPSRAPDYLAFGYLQQGSCNSRDLEINITHCKSDTHLCYRSQAVASGADTEGVNN